MVLPVPGTSSSSTCPSHSIAAMSSFDHFALADDHPLDIIDDGGGERLDGLKGLNGWHRRLCSGWGIDV